MVFHFERINGKIVLRHRSERIYKSFHPFYPCSNDAHTYDMCAGILTFDERKFFREVWKFCEEHRMCPSFYLREWGFEMDSLVQVIIDPEYHVLFKLRWM